MLCELSPYSDKEFFGRKIKVEFATYLVPAGGFGGGGFGGGRGKLIIIVTTLTWIVLSLLSHQVDLVAVGWVVVVGGGEVEEEEACSPIFFQVMVTGSALTLGKS